METGFVVVMVIKVGRRVVGVLLVERCPYGRWYGLPFSLVKLVAGAQVIDLLAIFIL